MVDIGADVRIDCNVDRIPDDCGTPPDCARAGAIGDGEEGAELVLSKAPVGGSISLFWGASCDPADTDYEVYEGTLGDFTSHEPIACGTAGATTTTISPGSGDTYYLVVPHNGTSEGSYGMSSDFTERSAEAGACLPQSIGACW